jgi:uncharacterized BrkB/YihY/UPF0761 family membrane protein
MPDSIVLIVAGIFTLLCLSVGGIGMLRAVKATKKNDGELAMVLWSVLALGGLSFGAMCIAYFIIPIISNRLF